MSSDPDSTSSRTARATSSCSAFGESTLVSMGIRLREEAVVTALCAVAALSLWLSVFVVKDSVRADLANVG
jgi:hypothetical protein